MSQAATPTFSPGAGSYGSAQTVMISSATPGSTIYYTTNGTSPTTSSPVYSVPITVRETETVNAIATASGYTQSNQGSAAYTIIIASGVPSAPTGVVAYAGPGRVFVRFIPPSNIGGSPITSYTATTDTGYSITTSAVLIAFGKFSFEQLNCRVDIPGLPAGTAVTVTVTATNSHGTSASSVASNSVTPATVLNPYYACPGNQQSGWSDFSYGAKAPFIFYGTTPGEASRVLGFTAPTNPIDSSWNVLECDSNTAGSNANFQPFFEHVDPTSDEGGRFFLYGYSNLIFSVYPTNTSVQQGAFIHFEKDLFVDGAASESNSGNELVMTDNTQNWPVNAFVGGGFLNVNTGQRSASIVSNTATTITVGTKIPFSAGDFYEVEIPDVGIGRQVSNIGGGTIPSGASGPTHMVPNTWNNYVIPLTAFNGGSGPYPNITTDQFLKFAIGIANNTVPPDDVFYLCNIGFT